MNSRIISRLMVLVALFGVFAFGVNAQDDAPTDDRSIVDLFTGSFASTRELLLYRKAAGPYIISVQGERFIDRAYFEIDVLNADETPAAPDTVVTVDFTPRNHSDQGGTPASYQAEYRNGLFVIDPILFDAEGGWLAEFTIEGAAGTGTTAFNTRVYPHKTDAPVWFNIVNIGVPVVVLGLLLMFYRWRGIALMKAPTRPLKSQVPSATASPSTS